MNFGFLFALLISAVFATESSSLVLSERHSHLGQKLKGHLITAAADDKRDVHTLLPFNLVDVDFRENQLVCKPHGVISATIKTLPLDSTKVTDSRNRNADEPVHEFVHARTPQSDPAPDGRTFTQLETRPQLKKVAFLIGGADGHPPELRERCDEIWSLSRMTMQHELALVVLLEQLYRVFTIKRGEPYHRE